MSPVSIAGAASAAYAVPEQESTAVSIAAGANNRDLNLHKADKSAHDRSVNRTLLLNADLVYQTIYYYRSLIETIISIVYFGAAGIEKALFDATESCFLGVACVDGRFRVIFFHFCDEGGDNEIF